MFTIVNNYNKCKITKKYTDKLNFTKKKVQIIVVNKLFNK